MPRPPNPIRYAILIACLAGIPASATAQSQTHDVSVNVPAYIGLRIVGTGIGPRSVTFDYAANPDAYFTAIDNGGSALPPTSVSRFNDVQLNVSVRGRWNIHVQATAFTYTGPATPAGLALSDVQVVRSGPQDAVIAPGNGNGNGNSATYATSWTLSTTANEIASSPQATGGWRSLGFSGWDYRLNVDGNEAPGTYTTIVTYSLTTP